MAGEKFLLQISKQQDGSFRTEKTLELRLPDPSHTHPFMKTMPRGSPFPDEQLLQGD
jgi:hypothetical protein